MKNARKCGRIFYMWGEEMATTPENWKTLGNLLFYPGLNKRFFYFASLLNGYTKHNDIYNPKANAIGSAAKDILSNNLDTNEINNASLSWNEKYKTIIAFLTKAIITEQQNEKAYLEGKIKLMKQQFSKKDISESPELSQIEAIYQQAVNGGAFNYNQFIIALNGLLQGLSNTKELFSYEYDRLNHMQEGLNQIYQNRENQIRGLATKQRKDIVETEQMIQQSMEEFDKKRKITYVADSPKISTLRGFKTNIKDVGVTSDVAISRWVNEVINKIFHSTKFINLAKKAIQECGYDKVKARSMLRPIIIKSVTSYALKHMDEVLNQQIYDKSITNIINELQDEIQFNAKISIKGYDDKFGEKGTHLDYFKKGLEGILEGEQHATGIYGAISSLYEKSKQTSNKPLQKDAISVLSMLKSKNPTLLYSVEQLNQFEAQINAINKLIKTEIKLTKKNQAITNQILNTTQSITLSSNNQNITINISIDKEGNITFDDKTNAQEQFSNLFGIKAAGINLTTSKVRSAITYTKGFLSPQLRKELDAEFEKGYRSTKQKLYDTLYYTLQDIDLGINGPILSEIKLLIQNTLINETNSRLNWIGKGNVKTDAFEIFTPGISNKQLKTINYQRDPNLKTLVLAINKKMLAQRNKLLDEFASGLENMTELYTQEHKKLYNRYSIYASRYLEALSNYTQKDKMIQTLIEKTVKQVRAQIKGTIPQTQLLAKILAERQSAFLNSLKNTLYISSTMKTYNEYQNDIGFIGGSLGGNVITQLAHLGVLFRNAGMELTKDEFEWLLFAIINCSSVSVVGEKNKNIIENYLGAIAAFALFDEAGAELFMLKQQLTDRKNAQSSSNILHLYGLNGIYYPGSFILTQVLESVQSMQTVMDIDSIESNIHNGISIINGANYKMIPNRNGRANTKKPSNSDPWGTVSKKVIASTHLKITFMAGLLGILDNLNSLMQEIPIPN